MQIYVYIIKVHFLFVNLSYLAVVGVCWGERCLALSLFKCVNMYVPRILGLNGIVNTSSDFMQPSIYGRHNITLV